MDDSRVLVAGGVGKRKKAKKNPKANPSTVTNQDAGSSQPVQAPVPLQQVFHHQEPKDMMMDNPFESEQSNHFSEHIQAAQETTMEADQANPTNIVRPVARITLEDPVHEILEKAGSVGSQVWSTSSYFNNF
ncbi:unnamed protein product, partial [Cuscuta europaea]